MVPSSDELIKLSTTATLYPALRSKTIVCVPMYPAPPVTRMVSISVSGFIFDSICGRLTCVTCVETDEIDVDWVVIVDADIAGDDDSDSFGCFLSKRLLCLNPCI